MGWQQVCRKDIILPVSDQKYIQEIIFDKLNPQQKEAVMHTDGPLLIFAGAGSGKTRVITNRIAYLIALKDIKPYNILAVTFTKKASEEMKSRVEEILAKVGIVTEKGPIIGTFHSICALILRKEGKLVGLENNYNIIDADDAEGLIKEILVELGYDPKKFRPSSIGHYIEEAKNAMVSPENYSLYYNGFYEDVAGEVYELYQKRLSQMNSVDFGDLLYYTVKVFKENADRLEKYVDLFKYILVDEYQDTNKVQYELIKMLAGSERNLCVVGDDDQGIYKWRGADVKNIIYFQNDFPDAKVVKLEQNYRSTSTVIHAAVSVIQQNFERVEKTLWTAREEGDKITVYQAENEHTEAEFIADEIEELVDNGRKLRDIAVLYRTNYQSRAIEEALLKRSVPYKLVGGFKFYDRKEIKDLLCYARFINNPKDTLSILRVINVPTRKMGAKSVSTLVACAKEVGCTLGELIIVAHWLKNSDLKLEGYTPELISKIENKLPELENFSKVISVFGYAYFNNKELQASKVLKNIVDQIKYNEYLEDGTEVGESKKQNVEELINVATSYQKDDQSLQAFLEGVALIESEQNKNDALGDESNRLILMTIHASKGLEFPVVFISGMEEGLLPHSRSFTETTELEEERRLCYVAITRAKDKLYMTLAENRMTGAGDPFGRIPSRFLGEIPQDLCDFYSWNS